MAPFVPPVPDGSSPADFAHHRSPVPPLQRTVVEQPVAKTRGAGAEPASSDDARRATAELATRGNAAAVQRHQTPEQWPWLVPCARPVLNSGVSPT